MPATLPTGTTIDVSFSLRLPVDASMEDLMAWLRFELGAVSTFDTRNALSAHELHGNTSAVRAEVRRDWHALIARAEAAGIPAIQSSGNQD